MKKYFFIIVSALILFFSWRDVLAVQDLECRDALSGGYMTWYCDSSTQVCGAIYGKCEPKGGGGLPISDVNACCKINHHIKFEGINFQKGCIVGEQYVAQQQESYCSIDGKEWELTEDIEKTKDCLAGPNDEKFYKKWGIVCLVNTIYSITDWLFFVMLTTAVFLFALAGFYYFTALGEPQKIGQANNILVFGIIGLAVALISKMVPSIVLMAAG
jgi:hypothetical protein